jgi:FKBP-type peptidyl-prolyl cis-trans isomerase FkpA
VIITMKRFVSSVLATAALGTLLGCPDKTPPPPPPPATPTAVKPAELPKPPPPPPLSDEDKQKALYGFGVLLAQRTPVAQLSLTDTELKKVVEAVKDVVGGKTPSVKMEEFGPKVDILIAQRQEEHATAEKKKGEEYLAKAAKEKGAQKLPSGLVLTTLKAGDGKTPAATDTVSVNYRGTLLDGTEFDSSYKRNAPATFPLNGVIKCWTEGVQKMKVGGKAKLVCPSDIAYGDRGAPPSIPGAATLIFEVELLEIKAPAPTPQMPPPAPKGATPPNHP